LDDTEEEDEEERSHLRFITIPQMRIDFSIPLSHDIIAAHKFDTFTMEGMM
jgi:hypothetical protein